MHKAASVAMVRSYNTDLCKAADGDSAGDNCPYPRGNDHCSNTTASHGATVRVADGHKAVNRDVHERVYGCDDKQRRHESSSQTQRCVEHPLGTDCCGQRERHCEHATEQVGHRQATEEHVGASTHAAIARDDDDYERVSDDGDEHDTE